MKSEHAEEYTQTLGQIVAGGWRQIALGEKLGVPKALGLSTRDWVEQRLGGYVRLSVEERHGAVKELTDEGLSTRQIAAVTGVSHMTVANDVKKLTPEPAPIDALAALVVGEAKDKQAKRRERETRLREEREQATAEARRSPRKHEIVTADIRTWRPAGVNAIVTDPPYITADAIDLYSALADFAVGVLPDHGALVTMCWQPILDRVIVAMSRPELVFRWVIAWEFDSAENNARTFDMARRVHDGWKPVLVYHKNGWADDCPSIYDVIRSPGRVGDLHRWEQGTEGVGRLIQYASVPGDTICDPFVGAGTTGVAALAADRDFLGADVDPASVAIAEQRLAA